MMILHLPWPPSVNHYWRHQRGRHHISEKGEAFRKEVFYMAKNQARKGFGKDTRLQVRIDAYPPDKRTRDLDNITKGLLDALQHAKMYEDDSQIDRLTIERCPIEKPGRVIVIITPYVQEDESCH